MKTSVGHPESFVANRHIGGKKMIDLSHSWNNCLLHFCLMIFEVCVRVKVSEWVCVCVNHVGENRLRVSPSSSRTSWSGSRQKGVCVWGEWKRELEKKGDDFVRLCLPPPTKKYKNKTKNVTCVLREEGVDGKSCTEENDRGANNGAENVSVHFS